MSNEHAELLPVEQADRDEAAALWVWLRSEHPRPDLTADDVARIEREYRGGKWDHDYTVQAFARHRLSASWEARGNVYLLQTTMGGLCDALRLIANDFQGPVARIAINALNAKTALAKTPMEKLP